METIIHDEFISTSCLERRALTICKLRGLPRNIENIQLTAQSRRIYKT